MLENILFSLGFNKDEAKTYLLLLEAGFITAGNLAKKTGIPRPSLYGFLKRLKDKGLVIESQKLGIKTFTAEPPVKITRLFEEKIEELRNTENAYRNMLPDLEKITASKFISPKFQLHEGQNGVRQVLKDMLLYSNIESQAYWPIKAMIEILSPEFFRTHNKERIHNNIYTRAIWPPSQTVDIKKHPYLGVGREFKREIRIAPNNIDFSMGYWIYGNKTAFISSRKESFGFIIESKELAEMLLSQFEVIWKLSKPVKVVAADTESFLKEIE